VRGASEAKGFNPFPSMTLPRMLIMHGFLTPHGRTSSTFSTTAPWVRSLLPVRVGVIHGHPLFGTKMNVSWYSTQPMGRLSPVHSVPHWDGCRQTGHSCREAYGLCPKFHYNSKKNMPMEHETMHNGSIGSGQLSIVGSGP
jgi:hypothetical protein